MSELLLSQAALNAEPPHILPDHRSPIHLQDRPSSGLYATGIISPISGCPGREMKIMIALTTALCVALASVSPAIAGWGGAEWGDSVTKVRGAYPAATEVTDGLRVRSMQVAGFAADSVTFAFHEGRLSEIRLENIHMNPTNMKSALVSQFGAGSSVQAHRCDRSRDCFETIVFVDRSKGNSIRYQEFFSRVSLTYTPIATPF